MLHRLLISPQSCLVQSRILACPTLLSSIAPKSTSNKTKSRKPSSSKAKPSKKNRRAVSAENIQNLQTKQAAFRKAALEKRNAQREALLSALSSTSSHSPAQKQNNNKGSTVSKSKNTLVMANNYDDDDDEDMDIKASLTEDELSAAPISWSQEKKMNAKKNGDDFANLFSSHDKVKDFDNLHSQLLWNDNNTSNNNSPEHQEENTNSDSIDGSSEANDEDQRMHQLLIARMKQQQTDGNLPSSFGEGEMNKIAQDVVVNGKQKRTLLDHDQKKNMEAQQKSSSWLSPSDEPRYLEPQIERQTRLAIRSLMMYYHSCVRFSTKPSSTSSTGQDNVGQNSNNMRR